MIRILLLLLIACPIAKAQRFTPERIFAHNDYVREKPFHTAYDLRVGYIEADVFLEGSELMVAHHKHEIAEGRTLESLYLKPMLAKIKKNGGRAYPELDARLTIMIDLKTEGRPTLDAVVAHLKKYPVLISCPTLQFMISGSVPDAAEWSNYPPYIFFDGRPGVPYTDEQLKRISMISTSFRQHVNWDGRALLQEGDRQKIRKLVKEAHEKEKPFRFWATPDFPEAWEVLMDLNFDVIVTDDVETLADFIRRKKE